MITRKNTKQSSLLQSPVGMYFLVFLVLLGCTSRNTPVHGSSGTALESRTPDVTAIPAGKTVNMEEKLNRVLTLAELPLEIVKRIKDDAANGALASGKTAPTAGTFFPQLEKILSSDDPYLRRLVDKQHPLPSDYEPDDLIELKYKSYRAGIADTMMLRRKAEAALEEMAAAAKKAGFTLTVSSAYRSYQYQIGSFDRWTARLGLEQAERISARPGRSQHQLGLTMDFGSISNDFADTPAGKWVAANAGTFGFSLSYPRNYDAITGYSWESWHYRYVGADLAAFINTWFEAIQQYALRFIHEWESYE